jgi:hypothetical protein
VIKIIDPRGFDWNMDRPIVQPIQLSSRGLVGADRSAFIKVASSSFLDLVDNIKIADGETPVHVIALGASEAYGPNRNGDGFKEATCKKYHDTFVKNARWYRNHKNKDKAKSYGYIKASAYNDSMRRIELLCMLNRTKEAAERNGGLVATREHEKLASGKDLSVSMACRVPHDICSGCGNKARTREEYCTKSTCKYGGCADNLTKVAHDGHILHVDNPDPTWFDMSDVVRPADRIAYGHEADYLSKCASAQEFMPGAELAIALGVTAPLSVILAQDAPQHWNTALAGQVKLAYALADLEQKGHRVNAETMRAFAPGIQDEVSPNMFSVLGIPGTEKCAEALGALADEKIIFPLKDFARWIEKSSSVEAASNLLPGVYSRLVERGQLEGQIFGGRFAVSTKTASAAQRGLARNLASTHAFTQESLQERSMRSSIRGAAAPQLKTALATEKQASDSPEAAALAEEYALYKLAALHRIAADDENFSLTGRLALAQNWV